ncbi:transposase [Actinoplanes sp. NPDC000266]
MINAIRWRVRTGSPWRDMPERYGPRGDCSSPGTSRGAAARTRPDRSLADSAHSSRGNRAELRRRGIRATIAEPPDQVMHRRRRGSAGGRPPAPSPRSRPATTRSRRRTVRGWPRPGGGRSRPGRRRRPSGA